MVPKMNTPDVCGNCKFAKVIPQDLSKRVCGGAPPTPMVVPSPQGMTMQMTRPVVEATMPACALYKERVITS
jgi:hypothetical protein